MKGSLRRRLLVVLLPTVVGVWLATAAAAIWQAQVQTKIALDANLAQSAAVILSLVGHEIQEHETDAYGVAGDPTAVRWIGELRAHLRAHPANGPLSFQVGTGTNPVMLRSGDAPLRPFASSVEGFSDVVLDDAGWRVYTLRSPTLDITVRVAEHEGHRSALLKGIVARLGAPLVVALPLLAASIWISVGHGLEPLSRVARRVARRDPLHLQPLGIADPPAELAPLVASLDDLFARLEVALESERRFTADAAHELRTPLTAIRAQAQVAERAMDPATRSRALEQLLRGVERATRLVEQLLELARLDASHADDATLPDIQPTSTTRLARDVLADAAPGAQRKGVTVSLEAGEAAEVAVSEQLLGVLLRNLIDNAIRYTPCGGEVVVRIHDLGREVRIAVDDSGPGIPASEREGVLRRFQRGPARDGTGTGLGLSIVSRIATLARATVRLDDAPAGGLSAVVEIPRAPEARPSFRS